VIPFSFLLLTSLAGPVPVPPWASGEIHLYDTSQVPILRGDSLKLSPNYAWQASSLTAALSTKADTGAYKLDLSGSKSLTVSSGDGGGVGVDASLLVNVKGQLANNVFLEGSLSDQNAPVQPDGSTASLRAVDNEYLRIYGKQYEYLLGDYQLEYGQDGVDAFAIQADGARMSYAHSGLGVSAQYAVSKGIFTTDTLHGVDGQQTGYYLHGRNGETFITVLAGTEKIWCDGTLLQRGTDYTMTYSQGRIDFLKSVWVTSENVFSAEFQYSENPYPHSVAATEVADTVGPFRFSARAIQEWDDKNNPAAGSPDSATLARYQQSGDSVILDSTGNPVALPQQLDETALSAEWQGGAKGNGRFVLLGSLWDQNLYSDVDDNKDLGFATEYEGVNRFGKPLDQGGFSLIEIGINHEHRSRYYESFHQLVEARSFRDEWNLDASVGERDFDANSLSLTLEPHTGFQFGVEGGVASGEVEDSVAGGDSVSESAESRRGKVFAQLHAGSLSIDASSEAKLASDPDRRDNYRQTLTASERFSGWVPKLKLLDDEWLQAASPGTAVSNLFQPDLSLASPSLWNRWVSTTDLNAIYGQSNYVGKLASPADSVIDIGISQRLHLLTWGPFGGDAFAARRYHVEWEGQADGSRPANSDIGVYDQGQLDFSAANPVHGYSLQTHYEVTRTAEQPLVNAYQKVSPGQGNYIYDSLLNVYQPVETGGNYVFLGLQRDTTVSARPYQDVQWSSHLDLSPGKWPTRIGGVLEDMILSLDVSTDAQDSASDPVPLPRLTDSQIEAVRSGSTRYVPSLQWRSPTGKRSATLKFERDFSVQVGLDASRELDQSVSGEYHWTLSKDWDAVWGGMIESKNREGLADSTTGSESDVDDDQTHLELDRHLSHSFTLIPSMAYEKATGEDAALPLDLQAVTPAFRVEKGAFYGGRISVEYGLHYLFGEGDGSYFATEGYNRGLTNRVEVLAQADLQTHLHLNLSYLARLEPGASSWDQKLTAEMRAVF